MNPYNIPFPKSSQSVFLKVSLAIAISIIFILIAFEPFGTSDFQHPYKYWILAGYGIVVFMASVIYYFGTKLLLSDKSVDRWSVMYEVAYVLVDLIFCLIACFFYWMLIFDVKFDISIFIGFLKAAISVAIFPVAVYFLFLYIAYRDVRYADRNKEDIQISEDQFSDEQISDGDIVLTSSNQSEVIHTSYNDLLCIKSSDNYVIVYSTIDGKSTRSMIRNTLKNIYAQLDNNAVLQCHRSYLVNTSKILDLQGNVTNSKLSLLGLEQAIPVSRSKVPDIRELLVTR